MSAKLNVKQWLIAVAAVFVGMAILEFLVHGVILSAWYAEHPEYWRSQQDMQSRMGWMYLGYALFSLLFTLIYTKGYEGKPGLGEGLRYGLWIGMLLQLPRMFIMHAVYPYPGKLLVAWLITGVIEAIIFGLLVGMIYKGAQKPATA
jgi:hypothetical protein